MSAARFFGLMLFGTILAWVGWGFVLFRIDPTAGGAFRFFLFYAILAAAIAGTGTIVGYMMRWKYRADPVLVRVITTSFRQGVWFALFLVVLLILQGGRWLRWWNALIIVVVLSGIEAWFLYSSRGRKAHEIGTREDTA